jgi:hypothetical protein
MKKNDIVSIVILHALMGQPKMFAEMIIKSKCEEDD